MCPFVFCERRERSETEGAAGQDVFCPSLGAVSPKANPPGSLDLPSSFYNQPWQYKNKPPPAQHFPETLHGLEMCFQSLAKLFAVKPPLLMFTHMVSQGVFGITAINAVAHREETSGPKWPQTGVSSSADCAIALRAAVVHKETIYKPLK